MDCEELNQILKALIQQLQQTPRSVVRLGMVSFKTSIGSHNFCVRAAHAVIVTLKVCTWVCEEVYWLFQLVGNF